VKALLRKLLVHRIGMLLATALISMPAPVLADPANDRHSPRLPTDGELALAEAQLLEMLTRVRDLRAAEGAVQRLSMLADLKQELERIEPAQRGDRLCPLCPLLLTAAAGADYSNTKEGRSLAENAGVFVTTYPRVPLSECVVTAAGLRQPCTNMPQAAGSRTALF
jgi:hypothetical protein